MGAPSISERLAHRISWRLFRGEIRNSLCVLHKCDNTSCVNPDHLFLGTILDNNMDMIRKGRMCRGDKHRQARLTIDKVISIRRDPRIHRLIAADFGVSRRLVDGIKNRKKWSWFVND